MKGELEVRRPLGKVREPPLRLGTPVSRVEARHKLGSLGKAWNRLCGEAVAASQ